MANGQAVSLQELTLVDCLRISGIPEDEWPCLSASRRAAAVVYAVHGGQPLSPKASDRKRAAWRTKHSVVYFLGAGPFVKIGKATEDPHNRISALKTGCPFEIELLGYIPGGRREESDLHARFAEYRAHGEWFRNEGSLAAYLAEVRA